jgi:hypothetical protein
MDDINNKNITIKRLGPIFWNMMFAIGLTYDVNKKQEYYNFLHQLQYVLPCEICKNNYHRKLKTLTDDILISKHSLLNWMTEIRNDIYISQKRKKKLTLKENIDEIYKFDNINIYLTIIYILILIILIMIYYICK